MMTRLGDVLLYEQPTKYIVESTKYNNKYKTPVLTAGQSFILGYTNETENIYINVPVIIFDDFTTSVQYVDFPFKVKSSAMKILTAHNADLKFLYYLLTTIKVDTGLHKRYWISSFTNMEIDLPTIEEQRDIADKLDTLQNIITNKKQQCETLDKLIKSQFIEVFGEPNSNPFNWSTAKLEDVCSSIVRGPFGSALKKEFFVNQSEETYKVYEQKHAIQKSAAIGTYYVTKKKYTELKRFECHAGDILMSCSGTMGELYQLPIGCEKGIINQALCKFTLNNKILPTVFLTYMRETIGNLESKGSGIQNIAAVSFVKSMPINLPPMHIQEQFATFVEQVDKSKFEIQQSLETLEILKKSLLQKYFG